MGNLHISDMPTCNGNELIMYYFMCAERQTAHKGPIRRNGEVQRKESQREGGERKRGSKKDS